jgi:hypothetical protein
MHLRRYCYWSWNQLIFLPYGLLILREFCEAILSQVKIEVTWAFVIITRLWHCRNPNLAKCAGEAQHLERVGIWSPPGLPNVQSSTARGKTPRIETFLVSLERSWNVDIINGLALVIWHLKLKLWAKEGPGVKLAVWLPTTKSRESTSSRCPIRECDMALERSRRGLQLWLRPRCDQTPQSGVMAVQSSGSPAGTISGLHFGSPNKMCHSGAPSAE